MQELIDYIKVQRVNGQSDETIRSALKANGWDDATITQAMDATREPGSPVSSGVPPKDNWLAKIEQWKYSKYVGIALVVLILAGIGFKAFTYFNASPTKVWKDAVSKMSEVDTAKFKVEASYAEPAPKDDSGDFSAWLGQGGEIKLTAAGEGSMDMNHDRSDADYNMNSTLTAKMGSFTVSLGLESRKIGDNIFYKTDGNPYLGLFGGFDSSDGQNSAKWIKYNLKDLGEDSLLTQLQKKQAWDAFNMTQIMKPTKLLGTEEINGKNTWHYQAELDKNELKEYFKQLQKVVRFDDEKQVEMANAVIDKIEFKKLELWIGKSDHMVYQALVETNAPAVIQASLDSARDKSRDARRFSDVRQMQTALELFYNDNGRYPTATNGIPTPTDGAVGYQFSSYLYSETKAPTPADGKCSEQENNYRYEQLEDGKSYRLAFCLGYDTGGYKAGIQEASPTGIKTVRETYAGAEVKDLLEGINFSATVQIKLNLSDFGANIKIEEPTDVREAENPWAKSRDARRLGDIRQIQTALELFYNDNGRYPTATNNAPTATDGAAKYTLNTYLANFPEAPNPADGDCSTEDNKYKYTQLDGGKSYKLTFCLGTETGGYSTGMHQASPSGIDGGNGFGLPQPKPID